MNEKDNVLDSKLMDIKDNMFGFAFSLTNNKEEAMELFQDTVLKVLDSRKKYTDKSNFTGWVFTIMRNIFINRYRQASRNIILPEYKDSDIPFYLPDYIIEDSSDIYTLDDISLALQNFPEDHKVPLLMFISGYKYFEIAEFMNLPIGTVKSRIHYAKLKLKKVLEE